MPDISNDLLRYAHRIDGLALGTAQAMADDVTKVLAEVEAQLRRRVPDDAPFTFWRFTELRRELIALQDALALALVHRLDEALTATASTTVAAVSGGLDRLARQAASVGVVLRTHDVPVEMIARVKDVPYDGMSWTRWGRRLADAAMGRVESELRQAVTLGETVPQISRRLGRVEDMARVSAERLSRTAINATSARTRRDLFRVNSDLIAGWEFLATLDSRTSHVCAGLSGRVFELDDPKAPFPPRHPNCRSQMVPRVKSWEELGVDLTEAPEGQQASATGPVPAAWSYEDWLRRQDAPFQREVLGEARYRAWRNGLSLPAMATYNRPLSISELQRIYPEKVPT